MQVNQIYEKYQIMPQLETHMLRVAGVGKIISENWHGKCDAEFATKLCLVHDLGNIVKFDLINRNTSKFGKIDQIEEWRKIQQKYWKKYGKNAHDATIGILHNAKLAQYVEFIDEEERLYFAEAKEKELSKASVPTIILMYADCRVTPEGVVSYRERINDLKNRYGGVGTSTWLAWTFWFEKWMQSQVKIDLNTITETKVEPLYEELLEYQL